MKERSSYIIIETRIFLAVGRYKIAIQNIERQLAKLEIEPIPWKHDTWEHCC